MKIITRPAELEENKRVLYAGNHYISLPEINSQTGGIKSINLISLAQKGLIELRGQEYLLKPGFFSLDDEKELEIIKVDSTQEMDYLPKLVFHLQDGINVIGRIYTDLKEKGIVYAFESSRPVKIKLYWELQRCNFLRFNSHPVAFDKQIFLDKWLHNPVLRIDAQEFSLAAAFGGEGDFDFQVAEGRGEIVLETLCQKQNCFYLALNADPDGASTTLIHLRRKEYHNSYQEFMEWLCAKKISYPQEPDLETRLNQNLFFNYYFAIGKDFYCDQYVALTSRSPRYYVSGAFWERDSFLWSMPALKIVNPALHQEVLRELILTHSKNPGDHAHYIDGTVLYPGFELDEAASYYIAIAELEEPFFDQQILKALKRIWDRIEEEYDPQTGLYKTFLLPSDDPADYPFVTIDNVILWRGLQNYRRVLEQKGKKGEAAQLQSRIEGIATGIYSHLVHEINGKDIFLWSGDGQGQYRLYNDPPGNLGLLHYYGFVSEDDPIFKNTIEYYYSDQYHYYFPDAKYPELACDHHPNTPSGLGLCGSLLNPLKETEALAWVRQANFDHGLLSESFDPKTGEAKTGVGFATGAGYLAFALYQLNQKVSESLRGKYERMDCEGKGGITEK